MKLFIVIIFLIGVIIIGFLVSRLLDSFKTIEQLKKDKNEFIKGRGEQAEQLAKQSDQLRQKGIEIELLKKELRKYSNVEIKVALTSREKGMILNAMDTPQYKGKIHDPKTNYLTREIYKGLKEKIEESIKE